MNKVKPKIIVISGPTASGKSDAAIQLAKLFNGEIISADSRQIFKGMNLGTGKVEGSWDTGRGIWISEGIPHHLIDIVEPMEEFNISHFQKKAKAAIEKILAKGKIPIICGGTGFWIQALTDNILLPEVKPDPILRNMLRNKSTEEIFSELQKLDPERAKTIDAKNPVRLVRAIEIATALGKVPNKSSAISLPAGEAGHHSSKYNYLQIAISVPREILNTKIKRRLEERFESGMIQEIENLHKQGVSFEWMEKIGLEYRWISRYLQGEIPLEEMKEKLYFDIIHYAKRQMTWLQKNKKNLWKENYQEIEKEVEKFLT